MLSYLTHFLNEGSGGGTRSLHRRGLRQGLTVRPHRRHLVRPESASSGTSTVAENRFTAPELPGSVRCAPASAQPRTATSQTERRLARGSKLSASQRCYSFQSIDPRSSASAPQNDVRSPVNSFVWLSPAACVRRQPIVFCAAFAGRVARALSSSKTPEAAPAPCRTTGCCWDRRCAATT